jgi:hypothetical protein
MKLNNKIRIMRTIAITAMTAISFGASALPNLKFKSNGERTTNPKGQLRTTAGTCKPAQSAIDLDINNVRARLMTGGDMWWDIGTAEARYEIPKGTKKNSLFAGSIWVGGYDPQGQLKVAAQTYRQDGNDYWPGPLDPTSSSQSPSTTASICSEWDRFWKVNKSDIIAFRGLIASGGDVSDAKYDAIRQWPARGNADAVGNSGNPLAELQSSRNYAPFHDADGDNIYNYQAGDYPEILGDQYIWWVFNDAGNVKQQSQTDAIGMEVQASAFAFATKDNLNNATFYNYRLINRGSLTLDQCFMSTWTDADLGYAFDDYIGCDTTRGLGILYNGKSIDGQGEINSYGSQIPMIGVDFFIGPSKDTTINGKDTSIRLRMTNFTYYNNDFTVIGNPSNGPQIYGYMTGTIRGGQHFTYDWNGVAGNNSKAYGTGPNVNFVFYGDPGVAGQWSECACNNKPDDRRFIHSAGPFKLKAGGVQNDVTIGAVWVADVGGCPNTSFTKIRAADDQAQDLFENDFRTIEGPEAPRLVIREMDRKLIFYIVNDSVSTNFQERFGYDNTNPKYRVSTPNSRRYATNGDSLYKFEGYRIFQVKNADIQPAQIFGSNGEVDQSVAVEVFQTDIKNGITRIINWDKQTEVPGQPYIPQTKVTGKDSGIVHSFTLEFDAFAKGADKRLVNYRNYHFVAVAYSYNNFRAFDAANLRAADSMQETPYLESAHGGGGIPIPVYHPMPNPALDDMGNYSSASYGTGVIIKRLEGIGNGGNVLQLSDASEAEALAAPYISKTPEYKSGQGPVNVKVVDPVKVQGGSWELYINGAMNTDTGRGINADSGTWRLVRNGTETIYSERNMNIINEQILEKYGLSVTVGQVLRPGEDQVNGNGYITSSAVLADPSKAWLAGVNDEEQRSPLNWIRSGGNKDTTKACNYSDYSVDTVGSFYEGLFANTSLLKGTWAPYTLASEEYNLNSTCDFGVARKQTTAGSSSSLRKGMNNLRSVDVVFTSDKSKWTKCVVFEMHDVTAGVNTAEGGAEKFSMRKHASWTGDVDASGNPIYDNTSTGFSWFPGYAIDQETGERLNMAFGEDSWLINENGRDMIWNPTSSILSNTGSVLFGGKHYIYVMNTRYDQDQALAAVLIQNSTITVPLYFQNTMMWVGVPRLNNGYKLLPLKDGLIPTETRLKFRVNRPYGKYISDASLQLKNNGFPLYSFSTDGLTPRPLTDASNPYASDKQALLDKIHAVPNPYYGYDGYEKNRLDTRVRIINLPRKATVSIYSLDGTLIRRLSSDNTGAITSSTNDDDKYRGFIDWDVRNAKGLPIASGMYLIHVQADGIGETVIRWFGSMRPIDVTTY